MCIERDGVCIDRLTFTAHVFEVAAVPRDTGKAQAGAELYVGSFVSELLAHGDAPRPHHLGVERSAEGHC